MHFRKFEAQLEKNIYDFKKYALVSPQIVHQRDQRRIGFYRHSVQRFISFMIYFWKKQLIDWKCYLSEDDRYWLFLWGIVGKGAHLHSDDFLGIYLVYWLIPIGTHWPMSPQGHVSSSLWAITMFWRGEIPKKLSYNMKNPVKIDENRLQ